MKKKSSLKRRLAIGFVKAMKKAAASASMADDKEKRRRAIRGAAYASMASVIGPRKAWSRAILRMMKRRKTSHRRLHRISGGNPRNELEGIIGGEELRDLSEVVPGGRAMDSWKLLNETAHYIKCLTAQVHIMTTILHYSST